MGFFLRWHNRIFFYEFSVMCFFFWELKASESIVAWYFFFFFLRQFNNSLSSLLAIKTCIHCTHILITYTCLIHLRITIVLVALSWYDSWFMKMKIIYIGICWYMFNTNCSEIHLAHGSNCSFFVCFIFGGNRVQLSGLLSDHFPFVSVQLNNKMIVNAWL